MGSIGVPPVSGSIGVSPVSGSIGVSPVMASCVPGSARHCLMWSGTKSGRSPPYVLGM